MCAADVRKILAILLCVQFHMRVPSPHSVSRCLRVSLCPQTVQALVIDIRLRLGRIFVGMMSWITLHNVIKSELGTGVIKRFFQTNSQSV